MGNDLALMPPKTGRDEDICDDPTKKQINGVRLNTPREYFRQSILWDYEHTLSYTDRLTPTHTHTYTHTTTTN